MWLHLPVIPHYPAIGQRLYHQGPHYYFPSSALHSVHVRTLALQT